MAADKETRPEDEVHLGMQSSLTAEEMAAIEEKWDAEVRFRTLARPLMLLASTLLFLLACYHYYTSGFGIPQMTTHTGIHLAFTLSLVFLSFSAFGKKEATGPFQIMGLPIWDAVLAVGGVTAALYRVLTYQDLAMRVGNPNVLDVIMGTIMIIVLLEAVRRSMGWPLPVIALIFIAYAYFGPSAPGILKHAGSDWRGIVNHLYLTSQGINGTALEVISTYVFHFVLFGVLAGQIGLGQLFIDLASALAGRFAGGPAKVSVLSSAMLGSISGSSIANTVTTGSLTIPAMIRIGYPKHFAAAVEAAASTGGQITPPVMGAVAFLMVEYLELPLTTILTAALVPAFMHFFGVLVQVHLEARRRGLRGLSKEELPNAWKVLKEGWLTIVPLILLVAILLSGRTPFNAAFWGITSCVAILIIQSFLRHGPVDAVKAAAKGIWDGFILGAKFSLSVTSAAALVGVIIGVVTLTGVGQRLAYIVTGVARDMAESVSAAMAFLPFEMMSIEGYTLLFTLLLTAIVCILMGCGIPTTANYLIMITVAQPILSFLGVQPLVSHFFVFYYGVLADITPPVALAAYAAAGIANANAFKAGNTAFRLGMGKALVPFVFVFSPSLLIVTDGFTLHNFLLAFGGAVLGIYSLSAAIAGWFFAPVYAWERPMLVVAALLLVAPALIPTLIGLALIAPVVIRQLMFHRGAAAAV